MLFYFCIVVHNGVGHILLLDFLWVHPNSLYWPIKSSGPNNVCNVLYIWIFIYIYIYKCKGRLLLFGLKKGMHCTLVLRQHMDWILGEEREELIESGFSHHHGLSIFLDTSRARKWLSMALIKVSISFIAI